MSKRRKHQKLTDLIYDRISEKPYDSIEKNLEYDIRGTKGEFDVLAIKGRRAVYYEIKCCHHSRSKSKAKKQFLRARRMFPQYDWQFIYITPYRVERMTYKL